MSESPAEKVGLKHEEIVEVLRLIIDPEIHYNIYDMGLIYDIRINGFLVDVDMTLTSPGCPFGPMLIHQVKESIRDLGADEVNLEIVWDPPWTPERMTEEARLELGFDL